MLSYVFGLVTYGSRCASTCVFASASRIKYAIVLCYYRTMLLSEKCVIIIHICIYMYILVYMYTYNRVTSICIDLSKTKLFVFVFMETIQKYIKFSWKGMLQHSISRRAATTLPGQQLIFEEVQENTALLHGALFCV